MWNKVKTIFSIIGAVLSVALFTFLLFLLRRGKADRPGSSGASESDTKITNGIDRAENGLEQCSDRVKQCEEHLQRAEEILREAIERSRKEGNNP